MLNVLCTDHIALRSRETYEVGHISRAFKILKNIGIFKTRRLTWISWQIIYLLRHNLRRSGMLTSFLEVASWQLWWKFESQKMQTWGEDIFHSITLSHPQDQNFHRTNFNGCCDWRERRTWTQNLLQSCHYWRNKRHRRCDSRVHRRDKVSCGSTRPLNL